MRLLLIPWFLLPASTEANEGVSLHVGDPPATAAAAADGGVINTTQPASGDSRWNAVREGEQVHWYLDRRGTNSPALQSLLLDEDGPAIQLTWNGATRHLAGKTIIGPQTTPMVEVTDSSGVSQVRYVMNGGVTVSELPGSLPTDLNRIDVVATDRFGNSARQTIPLSIDSHGPNIEVELLSRLDQNPEFSHYPAKLRVAIDDEHADIAAVEPQLLAPAPTQSTQDVLWHDEQITISAVDSFGNSSTEHLKWRYDTQGPMATVGYQGVSYSHRETVHVRRGDSVTFSVTDEGAGLDHARYRYNRQKPRRLPKSLMFADRGSYDIRVFMVDNLGNESQQHWRVIAK